jgi:formamidopyrimidine-DNA glycosylase
MPELPEVETIVRELRTGGQRGPAVVGQTIAAVTVRWPRHIATPSPRAFQRRLVGQRIVRLARRGKYLVFYLTRDVMLIHLKMSGDLVAANGKAPRDRHAHTIFHFKSGQSLRFSDTRKFGRVFLVGRMEEVTGSLGPEPLARSFTAHRLGDRLAARRRRLKPLLLDQTFLAGLGNIYTDEALYRAKLHPLRRSDSLTPGEVRALWRSIRRTLQSGIRHNGASIDWVYRGGGFQNHFSVYDRAGEPCGTCGTPIRRIVVGQRGTYFCPTCQKQRG